MSPLEILLGLIAFLVGIVQTLIALAWKDQKEQHAKDSAGLHKENSELRDEMKALRESLPRVEHAVLETEVRRLQSDYELLHQWKNVILPQRLDLMLDNATGSLERRIEVLERRAEKD